VEAAERLGMSRKFVVAEIDRGNLPRYRFGRVYRIFPADLDAYIAEHRVTPDGNGRVAGRDPR